MIGRLILENEKRIAVYELACRELQIFDINYQVPFRELSSISKRNISELKALRHPDDADQEDPTPGEPFLSFSLDNILEQCLQAELRIESVYDEALKTGTPFPELIQRQQRELSDAMERIRSLKTYKRS